MKKIVYLFLSMFLVTFYGCKEEEEVKIWLKEFLTTKVPTVF